MRKKNILLILCSVALFKSIYFSRIGFGLLDEGESLHNALRIIGGDVPYRDFYSIFPPLDNYFFAYVFRIFGASSIAPRIVMSFIFSFLPVFIFLITRKLASEKYAFLLSFLIIFVDVNVERLFFLTPVFLGIYLIIEGYIKRNPPKLLIAGILFGVVSVFRFDLPGTYFIGYLIAGIYYFYRKYDYWLSEWIFSSSVILIGYSVPIVIVFVYLYMNNLFSAFYHSTIVNSVTVSYLHSIPFPSIADIIPTKTTIMSLLNTYSAVLGYSILGVYIYTALNLRKINWKVWGLLLAGIFSLPYIFGRSEVGHFIKGGIPAFILLGYLSSKNKLLQILSYVFILVLLVVNIFQNLWWYRFNDQKIKFNSDTLILNSNYRDGTTLPSAETLDNSVEFIQKNTQKDDYILTLPYMAGLYYLTDRPSPTRYNNVLDGFITTEEGQRDFIKKVEDKNVSVVIYDPVNGPKMKNNKLKDYNILIHRHIMDNFEVVEETPEGWLFMLRK